MTRSKAGQSANLSLSHFELYVEDVKVMESFYTNCLGFVETDRGLGADGMVFLSRNPAEHHQLVLNPRPSRKRRVSPLDHISFRVSTLADVRGFYQSLISETTIPVETVSHGTTWSLYFRDPEENRLEIFCDTPWHVDQPCKFTIDLQLGDNELYEFTERQVQHLSGFVLLEEWRESHLQAVMGVVTRE